MKNILFFFLGFFLLMDGAVIGQNLNKRNTISLNGTWQIAEGGKNEMPAQYKRTIPVPGLITLAEPAFINPAPRIADRFALDKNTELFYHQQDSLRDSYWYRRLFTVAQRIPETAILKIGKAMFGTRVYLNGNYIGEHLPCFTPGYFNLKKFLKKGENELVVSVGSCRNSLPQDMPDGFDYEKERYISGIYDNVDLILSGTPNILNVQVTPDINGKTARIQVMLHNSGLSTSSAVSFTIKEYKTGNTAGRYTMAKISFGANSDQTIECSVPVKDCRYWSPGDPFLYSLEVSSESDTYGTRFGMRELGFDPTTHQAVLNGRPFFLRGSNVTIYRFFEDPQCGSLPWNSDWVRRMHQKFRTDMNWNSLRYCIGFPPEEWYNIADEEGILIQDEFPIWYGDTTWNKWTKHLNTDELAVEFKEWMKERWNHPCVVIWDASNETRLCKPYIDSAIARVRNLDRSKRSWDNSYSTSRSMNDIFESHPYHFSNPDFKLGDIAKVSMIPQGNVSKNSGNFPVIINEYGWLWLNRDGSPTTLTRKLYENLTGKNPTAEERRTIAAQYMAAETEFWRCHRKAAGVLHFTALGYDRPNGQTCDHWIDLKNLTWEPQFLKYVRNSFAPIGIMIDLWGDPIKKVALENIPVIVINDLDTDWNGTVRIRLMKEGGIIQEKTEPAMIRAHGQNTLHFSLDTDQLTGRYVIEAALADTPFGTITSMRNIVK